MRDRLLALIAGLLFPLTFAPYDLWPLLFVSIGIGYWCQQRAGSAREALFRGWLYGLGMFGFGISWVHVSMHDYGFMPLWMAIPFTGIFAAFLALFYGLTFYASWRLGRSALAFAGSWLLLDWVRGVFLTGFPWLYAGYALIDTPFATLAPIGGVWLLTLTIVLISASLVRPATGRRSWYTSLATAGALLVLTAVSHNTLSFTAPSGPAQKVALVQGNIPQDIKWQLSMRERTQQIYQELTQDIPGDTLVIWPESALTDFYQNVSDFVEQEGQQIADRNGGFITGVPWRTVSNSGVTYHNSIASIPLQPGDDSPRVYHKQKLVPFGEYVPMQSLIRGSIPFFDLPMSGFTPGRPTQPNLTALGHTVAPFICYEILYPEQVASRSHDADVLLTISNDAWFGTSAGPVQHFQMARMRAAETGRWLLRGTNNGVTAVIDHHGQVIDALPQFTRDVLYSAYHPRTGITPFMATGVWPWLLLSVLLIGLGFMLRNK